jgi:selT/selW/selH-like putative selenoprotein
LAAAIKRKTGTDAELIPGGSGIFDVVADDRLVFSKHDAGRFPEEDEVCAALDRG